ncbi:Uncharacterized protein L728 [Camellia lanceoleosa]|uniref:Uncharacterized protein L728 n=1 Tax=Camellia lanceoleosa TaxID=1840588 RepID=A0ACC0GR89_9ERIC|nr:Uncharacterized protein L728 [Camellia lanceoleosa]
MVEDLSKKEGFKKGIAVCDVSGSMEGQLMNVCVALGVLVSELSEYPWKGKIITFNKKPQLHKIQGSDLSSRVKFLRRMESGKNTNFQKVFKRVLEAGYCGNISDDEMIERVFVFTDMGFDEASGYDLKTEYRAIKSEFRKYGFNMVP